MSSINFERFFNKSLDMLCVMDAKGIFHKINPAFKATLGYTEEEMRDRSLADLLHPDDRDGILREIKSVRHAYPELEFETRLATKYGAYRWIHWRSFPVLSEGVMYTILKDVTEQKNMARQLQGMSLHDDLTRVYNRRGFYTFGESYLNLIPREKKTLLLLRLEVEKLREINAEWGQTSGDRLLAAAGEILRNTFRKTDIIARTRGGEFSVAALLNRTEEAQILIARLENVLEGYNRKEGRGPGLSFLIGQASTDTVEENTFERLMTEADPKSSAMSGDRR